MASTAPSQVPPPPALAAESDIGLVLRAQHSLKTLGYYQGAVDGVDGPVTKNAVLLFQRAQGLQQDGEIDLALCDRLKAAEAVSSRNSTITVEPGETIIYSDGTVELVKGAHALGLAQANAAKSVMTVRPSTGNWPAAARAGLDWAITHALETPASASPVVWSSTGVPQHYLIHSFASLSPQEEVLVSDQTGPCRHFELQDGTGKRYPGFACREIKGSWYLPNTKIVLANKASALNYRQESTVAKPTANSKRSKPSER